jgi:hypothetical protein
MFSISSGRMFSPPKKLDGVVCGGETSDDDIFDAACDGEVSVFIH